MTLNELVQRAIDIAAQGLDTPVLRESMEVVVEPLIPVAFNDAGDKLRGSVATRSALRSTKDLAVVDGVVTLPNEVMVAYLGDSLLYDPEDISKSYSLVDYADMVRDQLDDRLGYYAVKGNGALQVVEPGEDFDPTAGPTVDLKLTTPCVPLVPALNATVDVTPEVSDVIIERLAQLLRAAVVKA